MSKKLPPPIPHKIKPNIDNALRRMEDLQLSLAKQPFKMSELLTLFVDPKHRDILTEAYRLCEPSGHVQELYVMCEVPTEYGGGVAHMRFSWHGIEQTEGFIVPHRAGSHPNLPATIRNEAPVELCSRFIEVAQEMIGVRYRFSLIRRTLASLNRPHICRTLAQLRYHWPCIVPLLRAASYNDLAQSVEEPDVQAGDRANLYPKLRAMLAPSNQALASHFLIEGTPEPAPSPVDYDLQHRFP